MRQREFENIAVRNQVFLQVALAYSELLRAEGRHAVALQAREEARAIARLTADYAVTGQGRVADANRAATELQRREAYIKQVESEVLTASARLCQLLNLDPSIRLHPTDAYVVPHPLVPDPIPVARADRPGPASASRAGGPAGLGHPGPAAAGGSQGTAVLAHALHRLQCRRIRRRQQPGPADLRRLRRPDGFRRGRLLDDPEPGRRQRRADPGSQRQPPGQAIRADRGAQPGAGPGGRGLRAGPMRDTPRSRPTNRRSGPACSRSRGSRRGSGIRASATSCRSSCSTASG